MLPKLKLREAMRSISQIKALSLLDESGDRKRTCGTACFIMPCVVVIVCFCVASM